jgi:N-succinyldiaminopimelate aminotransferase
VADLLVARMRPFGTTVFSEMTALAQRFDAANLGQGFPDDDPPAHLLAAAHAALDAGHHQYAPGPGVPALREAIAAHQLRIHDMTVDPDTEVTVTFGATEALAATVLALCGPGDEVLLLDPSYDAYAAAVAMAGATAVHVPMSPPDLLGLDPAVAATGDDPRSRWTLDVDRVAAAVTPRTRALIVNTPHNPTGMVMGTDLLDALAAVCVEHDLIAITDEVYEHLTLADGRERLDGRWHVPLATRPGMAERTVTISSAGKTFSCTGWKIGWACAPPPLSAAVRATKQFLSFSGGTPLQHAVAAGLGDDAAALAAGRRNATRHELLTTHLVAAGLPVAPAEGTYFLTLDVRSLGLDGEVGRDGDAFCRWAPEHLGVAAVPVSAFYADPGPARPLIRLATCKRDEVLATGVTRLASAATLSR